MGDYPKTGSSNTLREHKTETFKKVKLFFFFSTVDINHT